MVAATLALLAVMAWAFAPDRPAFKPAPLAPPSGDCLKVRREFLPSNATEIPDSSLTALTPAQKNRALYRLNMEPCTCGCSLSVAACRASNPDCEVSKALAEKIIAEVRSAPAKPADR